MKEEQDHFEKKSGPRREFIPTQFVQVNALTFLMLEKQSRTSVI